VTLHAIAGARRASEGDKSALDCLETAVPRELLANDGLAARACAGAQPLVIILKPSMSLKIVTCHGRDATANPAARRSSAATG
jgi:hypothetical protein